MAIQSFLDIDTESFFLTGRLHKRVRWNDIAKIVMRKLDMLHYAKTLSDLQSPPGNKLELLSGDLRYFYSIRINDQWRIIFRWSAGNASAVEIIDYH